MKDKLKIFLDSGAFTAFTKGVKIDIHKYIEFINKHKDVIEVYANLDVIVAPGKETSDRESAELTLQNQRKMEEAGLEPLPVFHRGEPEKYLKNYVENYDYIGIGLGRAKGGRDRLQYWLNKIFSRYICDENGDPKIKVHGFGVGSFQLIHAFPWYSVDSSSRIQHAINGQILIPQKRSGEWCYTEPPHVVSVKELQKMPDHSYIKKLALEYIEENGFKLGSGG